LAIFPRQDFSQIFLILTEIPQISLFSRQVVTLGSSQYSAIVALLKCYIVKLVNHPEGFSTLINVQQAAVNFLQYFTTNTAETILHKITIFGYHWQYLHSVLLKHANNNINRTRMLMLLPATFNLPGSAD